MRQETRDWAYVWSSSKAADVIKIFETRFLELIKVSF